jgi:hypothetical protein
MLTGEAIELFLDQDKLEWGDEWRPKIDLALSSVIFFVPIITPRYFQSKECRRELNFFARRATQLGITELVMPIKYVDFPALTLEDPSDDSITLARSFQWEDWTDLRFSSSDSSEYRRSVSRLAERMVRANSSAEQIQMASPREDMTIDEEDDNSLGFIDVIARAEEALPSWSVTVTKLGEEIVTVGAIMSKGGEDIKSGESRGKGFAARLEIARQVSISLEDPTTAIESLANSYASQLHEVDLGMKLIIERIPSELESNPDSLESATDFCKSVKSLADSTAESLGHLESMTSQLEEIEKMSRGLRP